LNNNAAGFSLSLHGDPKSLVLQYHPAAGRIVDIGTSRSAKRHRSTFVLWYDARELLFSLQNNFTLNIRITPVHRSICFVLRVDEAVGDGP
jgi:hypothetical protein